MQKLLNKITSIIVSIVLLGTSYMPVVVYATENIAQDSKTTEKNVEFNATLNGAYDSSLDVNEEGTLELNIKVSETGYLKDPKVSFGNNNYQVENNGDANIISIKENVIELDEVKAGEMLNVALPIKLPKVEYISNDVLGRDSTITLNATYVNENGKEKKITKTLNEHLEWTADAREVVNQTLIRYIKLDDNKTMVSFRVNEGIEDNKIPVTNKEIKINVPTLGNAKPEQVIVTGHEIEYSYENDVITIKKVNTPNEDGQIKWDSQDEYIVTYIFNTQVEEENITSPILASAEVKGEKVTGTLENANYLLKEQVGNHVEAEISSSSEINKGYMYTNLKNEENNLETDFEVKVSANVGYKLTTDTIKISEKAEMFNSVEASNSITNKKVRIDEKNLVNVLGQNGTLKVLSEDGTELGVLSKDSLELEVNADSIVVETSQIENEGNIELTITKAIKSDISFSKEEIKEFNELTSVFEVMGYKGDEVNSTEEISTVSKLVEPKSNANIDLNIQNLSTIIKNENVVITTILHTNDIADALYTNSKINITLPEEVKDIEILESELLYEDELKLENVSSNGNVISLELNGSQTKYSNIATSEGTAVRLVTNLTLDNLAPSAEKEITLDYSNEATGEQNRITKNIGIIAPTGFVTTNSIELDGDKVTSQETTEQIAKIQANDTEKEVKVGATIVNNLEDDISGVTIVGTIPTSGNKNANDVDLGSNFDTKITSGINVENTDADIYYSENVNENINSSNWTNNYTENAKSYKIVLNGTKKIGDMMKFDYAVKVPANLEYGKTAKTDYAVYYNNNAQEGNNQNIVIAKAVGLTTGEIPAVEVSPVIIDVNTGKEITNEVKEGEFILYRLNVKNTGKEIANNVKLTINLPEGIGIANLEYDMSDAPTYVQDETTKTLTETIDKLNPNETKTLEYRLIITKIISGMDEEDTSLKISVNVTADKLEEDINTEKELNVIKGSITAQVTSDKTNEKLKKGDKVYYNLSIKNANFEEKNNIQAQITFPKELKVISDGYNYNEKENKLTYTINNLAGGSLDGIVICAEVQDFDQEKQIEINAKVKCDGIEEEKLETLKYNLVKSTISASLSSNIVSKNLNDTDTIEYYINVTNNSSEIVNVDINDTIPTSLRVLEYEINDNKGKNVIETGSREIIASLEINANDSARLTIKAKPYTLEKGRISEIENKATIIFENNTIETNKLNHTIVGSSSSSAGLSTEPDGVEGTVDEEQAEPGTYKVSGTVWIDENRNGQKEESEQKVSGLNVKLYNKQTGKTALDINGKELVTTTNDSGAYSFINIVQGEYVVVIEYDNVNYAIAQYKVNNLSDSENCDFIEAKIDGKSVASTDKLELTAENKYNIDLGLVKDKVFDLDISKTVTRISVTNTKSATKTYDYNNLSVAKVELASKNVEFATVLIEYTIKVTNNGTVAGYAKSIIDEVPEGMTFSSELNSSWYLGQDKNAYNTSLANTIINPGETKEIKLILSRKMTGENTGTVRNTARILTSYNEYGLNDVDTQNKEENVQDKSSADVVINMATGKEVASITGIALGILSIIAVGIYEIKKHIINKMYNII